MRNRMFSQYAKLAIAMVVTFGSQAIVSQTANAAINLNLGIVDNDGFQIGTTNNDSPIPGQVNADQMFGFSDWVFAEKLNFPSSPEESIDIGLTVVGGEESGTWAINNVWGAYADVMLVLKGGSGNNTQPTYVGYRLVQGDTAGTYATIFANATGGGAGNPKEISHISAYVRAIPEPGSLSLSAIGLVATCFLRRRRRP